MKIHLSDHFTYTKLLRFTLPSIAMMIFTSVYGVVDGFFVSNFVGKTPFAAVNFIMPFLMILSTLGFMFGTGGSALISKTMGEGDHEKANRIFSMITYVGIGLGVIIALLGILFIRPIAAFLGAEGRLLEDCVLYGRINLAALPFFILQMSFQSFFVTAEKPQLGLFSTVFAGVSNMVLDALLVAVFRWGLVGAALATSVSQLIGGLFPIFYFAGKNSSLLRLGAFSFDLRSFLKICANGSSELMSNVSMSLVGMLYNVQLIRFAGEDGVAAYGVLMYVSLIFIGAFIGYSIGTAPVIGYHFGAKNTVELKSILRKSFAIVGVFSLCMFLGGELLAKPLSQIFVGYDPDLYRLTLRGFFIFSFSFLFSGVPIFVSGFFTALNNGFVSALVSFLRTMVFQGLFILILPYFFDVDGIWYSIVVAEIAATLFALFFIFLKRKKYQY